MSRCFNFSAGPACLPEPVLKELQDEMLEWGDERASMMELSHRGRGFLSVARAAEADLRNLMAIPDDYAVLFLQGGATQQFALIPMNLARPDQGADYLLTGSWGKKAYAYGKGLCRARVAASSEAQRFSAVPAVDQWDLDADAAYLHVTPNETIGGVEFFPRPFGSVPLVADMSSTILSRLLDVSDYGLIYAGAQKNIGPSGLVLVIIRRDLLERCPAQLPPLFSYSQQAANESMLNTPNTFGWYVAGKVFRWLLAEGGLAAMGERNRAKAASLYERIERGEFYSSPVDPACRSWMNVPFKIHDPALEKGFVSEAEAAGLHALAGHRDVGGMRASLYNAMPQAGVDALIAFMDEFERRHG